MTGTHDKRPKHASVEDYDDDASVVIPATREYASSTRARNHGSDSGYGSRTGTVDGDNPPPKPAMAEGKEAHIPIERQRQPYIGGAGRTESVSEKRSVSRPSGPERVDTQTKPFRHPEGVCWPCDRLGYHITQEEVEAIRGQNVNVAVAEEDDTTPLKRQSSTKTKRPDPAKMSRRMSAQAVPKSNSFFPPSATPNMPALYGLPMYAAYTTSPAPAPYATSPYTYSRTPITASTPVAAPGRNDRDYYNTYDSSRQRPPPPHRNSMYAGPRPAPDGYKSHDYPNQDSLRQTQSRQPVSNQRPKPLQIASYDDRDHHNLRRTSHHDDMQDGGLSRRYSTSKRPGHGQSTVRARDLSPRREQIHVDYHNNIRPAPKHVVSDSISARNYDADLEPISRRVTEPTDFKLAQAEAHMERTGSMDPPPIPASKQKQPASSRTHARSETGSNHSHQPSHYSSSKASTSTSKGRRPDSLIIETKGNQNVSIDIPDGPIVTIVSGSPAKSKSRDKDQKLLEHRATPTASQTSKPPRGRSERSYTTSDRGGREREGDYKMVRRISNVIGGDKPPPSSPVKAPSKRSSSRTASRSRASSYRE